MLSLAACVVALDQTVTISQPVDRIVVDVSSGDVKVVERDGDITLSGAFGGAGHGPIHHEVDDGVLTIRYDCKLCGGDLKIEAPSDVELDLRLGAGDLTVVDMGGTTDMRLEVGSVDASFRVAPDRIDVDVGTGAIELVVPAGGYALDVTADRGSVDLDGVHDDPASDEEIVAHTANGSVEVLGFVD